MRPFRRSGANADQDRLVPYEHYDAILLVHSVTPVRFWPNDPP